MRLRKILTITGIAVLLFLLAGCERVVKVDSSMNGSSVVLEKGQQMVLKLESNPTTGFNWQIADLDTTILAEVGEAGYKSDSMLIGSGGVNTYTFEAISTGVTHLKLIYLRSWEDAVAPIDTFDLDIVVK